MLIPEDLGSMSVHTAGMIIPQIIPLFLPSGKIRASNVDKLMGLIGEVLCHTSFEDTARLREILLQEKSEWDMSVFSRGSSLVMTRAFFLFL